MKLKPHIEIPAQAKKVFQGDIFSVWQWQQKLYDGTTALYEMLDRPDTVHTVGVLPDGKIMLTLDEQPNRPAVITPSGGRVEAGEAPEEAAQREYLEETGYEIGELLPWHEYQVHSKISWIVHAFVGRGVRKIGEPAPEAGEKIQPLFFSFDEFLELGHNPEMRDLVIRIILLEAKLDPKKREELKKLMYG